MHLLDEPRQTQRRRLDQLSAQPRIRARRVPHDAVRVQILAQPPGLHPETQRVPLQHAVAWHRRRGGLKVHRLVTFHELRAQVHHHAGLDPAAVDPELQLILWEVLRRAPVVHREVQRQRRDHPVL